MGLEDAFTQAAAAFAAAPFDGARWSEGLDLFASIGGGWAGQLLGVDAKAGLAFNIVTRMPPDATQEWEARGGASMCVNPRAASLSAAPFAILADDDFIDARRRATSPIYREFFEKVDANYISVAMLGHRGDLRAIAAVIRTGAQGHPQAIDHRRMARLLPHIDAALTVQRALERRTLDGAIDTLDALGMAAFQCDRWGRIVGATALGEELLAEATLVERRGGRLRAIGKEDDARLRAALDRASGTTAAFPAPRSSTIALATAVAEWSRVDVAPCPGGIAALSPVAVCIVLVHRSRPPADAVCMLRSAFGLTGAEAAVALALATGATSRDIADRRGVSRDTVKVQVAAIYQKVGVTKATQLARLIARMGL